MYGHHHSAQMPQGQQRDKDRKSIKPSYALLLLLLFLMVIYRFACTAATWNLIVREQPQWASAQTLYVP
jgi:hypothetical protein